MSGSDSCRWVRVAWRRVGWRLRPSVERSARFAEVPCSLVAVPCFSRTCVMMLHRIRCAVPCRARTAYCPSGGGFVARAAPPLTSATEMSGRRSMDSVRCACSGQHIQGCILMHEFWMPKNVVFGIFSSIPEIKAQSLRLAVRDVESGLRSRMCLPF